MQQFQKGQMKGKEPLKGSELLKQNEQLRQKDEQSKLDAQTEKKEKLIQTQQRKPTAKQQQQRLQREQKLQMEQKNQQIQQNEKHSQQLQNWQTLNNQEGKKQQPQLKEQLGKLPQRHQQYQGNQPWTQSPKSNSTKPTSLLSIMSTFSFQLSFQAQSTVSPSNFSHNKELHITEEPLPIFQHLTSPSFRTFLPENGNISSQNGHVPLQKSNLKFNSSNFEALGANLAQNSVIKLLEGSISTQRNSLPTGAVLGLAAVSLVVFWILVAPVVYYLVHRSNRGQGRKHGASTPHRGDDGTMETRGYSGMCLGHKTKLYKTRLLDEAEAETFQVACALGQMNDYRCPVDDHKTMTISRSISRLVPCKASDYRISPSRPLISHPSPYGRVTYSPASERIFGISTGQYATSYTSCDCDMGSAQLEISEIWANELNHGCTELIESVECRDPQGCVWQKRVKCGRSAQSGSKTDKMTNSRLQRDVDEHGCMEYDNIRNEEIENCDFQLNHEEFSKPNHQQRTGKAQRKRCKDPKRNHSEKCADIADETMQDIGSYNDQDMIIRSSQVGLITGEGLENERILIMSQNDKERSFTNERLSTPGAESIDIGYSTLYSNDTNISMNRKNLNEEAIRGTASEKSPVSKESEWTWTDGRSEIISNHACITDLPESYENSSGMAAEAQHQTHPDNLHILSTEKIHTYTEMEYPKYLKEEITVKLGDIPIGEYVKDSRQDDIKYHRHTNYREALRVNQLISEVPLVNMQEFSIRNSSLKGRIAASEISGRKEHFSAKSAADASPSAVYSEKRFPKMGQRCLKGSGRGSRVGPPLWRSSNDSGYTTLPKTEQDLRGSVGGEIVVNSYSKLEN